ncbi:MAG: branched-chain amino acid ABC transporter permease [Xanthobacteraceae bacterium]
MIGPSDAMQRHIGLWLTALLLAAAPLVYGQSYFLHIVSLAMISAIAALGMQLVLGFAGQLSLGQAAFFGIGAYTSALMTKTLGVPFPIAFLAAGIIAAISSLALAPITRLTGVYLGVATLGFTIIVHLVLLNEEWLTGGSFGILSIPWPNIGPFVLKGERAIYYLCLVVMIATYLALSRIVASRFGRALRAIMLDEDAARASGINVTLYKSKCFVIAALVTGFAGSLFAHHSRYLNPNDFTFWKSIEILIMVAVGGLGSLPGAVLGAFVVVLLPEYLRALDQWRLVIYGALLIVLMGAGAGGIAGLVALSARRFAEAAASFGRRVVPRTGKGQL